MSHAEICFEWHGTEYGIFWINGEQWVVTLLGEDDSQDVLYKNSYTAEVTVLTNSKLIDICTKFTVIERTF